MLTEYCKQNGLDPVEEMAGIEARQHRDEVAWRALAMSLEPLSLPIAVGAKWMPIDSEKVPNSAVRMGPLLLSILRSRGSVKVSGDDLLILPTRPIEDKVMDMVRTHKLKIVKEIAREKELENRNGHHAGNGKSSGAPWAKRQASRVDMVGGKESQS